MAGRCLLLHGRPFVNGARHIRIIQLPTHSSLHFLFRLNLFGFAIIFPERYLIIKFLPFHLNHKFFRIEILHDYDIDMPHRIDLIHLLLQIKQSKAHIALRLISQLVQHHRLLYLLLQLLLLPDILVVLL